MPSIGWNLVQSDGSLKPMNQKVIASNGSTLNPVTVVQMPRLGIGGSGGGGGGGGTGGGGGEPPIDWRSAALLDPGAGKVVAGMWVGNSTIPTLAGYWGASFNLSRTYTGTGAILQGIANAQNHLNAGRVPAISINWKNEMKTYVNAHLSNIGGTGKTWMKYIADGNFDGDSGTGMASVSGLGTVPGLRAVARAVKALTRGQCPTNRVILTPWHEFENTAESGFGTTKDAQGLTDFRNAWHRLRTIFDAEGVGNVYWGFCGATGVGNWGTNMTDTSSTGFYPGHAYVDMTMWDPYNSAGQQSCAGAHGPRYGNSWEKFGIIGDRGDGHTNTVLNRWGQMTWWFDNFKMGGAATAAAAIGSQGVYKPVWLGELGTGEYDPGTPSNPATQADIWFDEMIAWCADQIPGVDTPLRGWIYYNNLYNDLSCSGSHRRAGFTGRGTADVWATVKA